MGFKSGHRTLSELARFGPAARRARERQLDTAAVGSKAAKHGTPEPVTVPVSTPSRADALFALAKALRRAGAPARAALKAAAKAAAVDMSSALVAAEQDAAVIEARAALERVDAEARSAEAARLDAARAAEADRQTQVERARTAEAQARIAAVRRADEAEAELRAARRRMDEAQAAQDGARAQRRAAAEARTAAPHPTAAAWRGHVDPATPWGRLLVMAPSPGGHGARCFAELLRRAATGAMPVGLGAPSSLEDDGDAGADRLARTDLLALSDLYAQADGFYRTLAVPAGEGPPVNGNALRVSLPPVGGSISSQLVDG